MTPPPDLDRDQAYEAGLRAGYAHGYDIGLAHGRAHDDRRERESEDGLERDAAGRRDVRLDGPTRDELIARGHIPTDHTRPPALPVRLWDAGDWAKADERDLPTTDIGHAHWRAAIAAGDRVPAPLAALYAEATGDATGTERRDPTAELADTITRTVADTDRTLAALRARMATGRIGGTDRAQAERVASRQVDLEAPDRERGIGR